MALFSGLDRPTFCSLCSDSDPEGSLLLEESELLLEDLLFVSLEGNSFFMGDFGRHSCSEDDSESPPCRDFDLLVRS